MAAESNWLSFSLSSIEKMLNSSSSSQPAHHHHYYSFADNFYASAGWPNQRAEEAMNSQDQNSSIFTTYIQPPPPPPPPKLEEFFGGDSTETQDSPLGITHIYDHHQAAAAAYVDLKSGGFSANSGSELDDSGQTRSPAESAASQLVGCAMTTNGGGLSIEANTFNDSDENSKGGSTAIVVSKKKIAADTFGQRTSIYRGVTKHRWTGRYEAHLWDNSCRREGQARKGRQVYLGGYDKEEKAARAYDLAALKYWGSTATTNFPITNYTKEVDEMEHVTKQEFIASLRRKSSGFSRGASIYRGVTRHHQQGRWQSRIGRVAGNKDLYLGTFATEEEAAEAYDVAAIKFRGVNAVTNFEMSRYDVEAIAKSTLPIGGAAKRLKISLEAEEKLTALQNPCATTATNISFGAAVPCGIPPDQSALLYHHNLFGQPHCTNPDNSGSSVSQSEGELFVWPHQNY